METSLFGLWLANTLKNRAERKEKVLHSRDPYMDYRPMDETLDDRSELFWDCFVWVSCSSG